MNTGHLVINDNPDDIHAEMLRLWREMWQAMPVESRREIGFDGKEDAEPDYTTYWLTHLLKHTAAVSFALGSITARQFSRIRALANRVQQEEMAQSA